MKTSGGFLIAQISRLQARIFERLLRQSSVDAFNGAQGRILYVLWECERLTITEISRLTSLSKTALTTMLDRMEQADLVKRVPDTHNRRQVFIVITPKAKAYQKSYDQVSSQMNQLFYQRFSEKDVAGFEDSLRKIIQNLEEHVQ
jgi:DNA-binding MarR family transcriptional regulator